MSSVPGGSRFLRTVGYTFGLKHRSKEVENRPVSFRTSAGVTMPDARLERAELNACHPRVRELQRSTGRRTRCLPRAGRLGLVGAFERRVQCAPAVARGYRSTDRSVSFVDAVRGRRTARKYAPRSVERLLRVSTAVTTPDTSNTVSTAAAEVDFDRFRAATSLQATFGLPVESRGRMERDAGRARGGCGVR